MGQPSDDIYYKFTLSSSTLVKISHCASGFDTYMHLLNVNGGVIASNDDNGPLCASTRASMQTQLNAGTYYVVSEGYSTYSGAITTSISAVLPIGANITNAIQAGVLNSGVQFSDTKNNSPNNGYRNDIGGISDDIYYAFTLSATMEVEISHCSSAFDTYLYLLDGNGGILASNDDNGPLCATMQASIKKQLPAGTYYVVSEGYSSNFGDITTSIRAIVVNRISGFQLTADSMLQYLDKSPIITGLLYDRVYQDARLDIFNLYQTDTSSYTHFLQANYELYSAAYNPTTTGLLTRSGLENLIVNNSTSNIVPIGILHYNFNYIDSAAITNNLLTQSGSLYYDVPNRPSSPYKQRRVLLAAALITYSRTSQVKFKLDPALFFTNTGTAVNFVTIDFGNGAGPATYYPSTSPIYINYPSAGIKIIRYTVNYGNNQQVTTASAFVVKKFTGSTNTRIIVEGDPCYRPADLVPPQYLEADIAFTGYDESVSRKGLGDVSYYYATTKTCDGNQQNITKPIIVIDGIDNNDSRNGSELYNSYLNYFDANKIERNLGKELRSEGYDVVVLNFPNIDIDPNPNNVKWSQGGVDWIERNAFVLIKLIQQLNAQKAAAGSTEKNIVVGPSMGGQVSRYALAYMEKMLAETGNPIWDHQTRLWVSLDSPHLGANVPIGVQHFVRYYAEEAEQTSAKSALEYLNSPASREMTLHHNSAGEFPAPAAVRANYLAALAAVGNYPKQLRKIAIANGSQTGANQLDIQTKAPFSAKQQMYLLEHRGFPWGIGTYSTFPLSLLGRYIVTSKARVYFTPSYGERSLILDAKIGLDTRKRYAQAPAYSCSYDVGPGGYFDIQADIISNETSLFERTKFFSTTHGANFIPVFSSLAYTKTNPDLCENISTKNLVCTQETPFDAYYAPNINQEHIELTVENVAFIKNEIAKTPQSTGNYTIIGPTSICMSGAQFSISNLPTGATVNWTSSSNISIQSGQGIGTATFVPTANQSGGSLSFINATITANCGTYQVSKQNITTNIPNPPIISGPSYVCAGGTWTVSLPDYTSTVQWDFDQNAFTFYNGGPNTNYISLGFKSGYSSGWVSAKLCNSCGCNPSPTYYGIGRSTSGCAGTYAYSYYPNPATDELNVSYEPISNNTADIEVANTSVVKITEDFEAKLLDEKGKILLQGKNKKGSKVVLKTKDIPNGTYYLHIVDGEEVITNQIIIKH